MEVVLTVFVSGMVYRARWPWHSHNFHYDLVSGDRIGEGGYVLVEGVFASAVELVG